MSLIVMGLSHRSAPVELLEQAMLDEGARDKLWQALDVNDHVREQIVVSTCNRIEVYAEVDTFHGAVTAISDALGGATGVAGDDLRDHLYVHFEDRAVSHMFSVAAGLDSMAVGESQILGQLREALRQAQETGRLGSALSTLFQQALRVGKRAHAETGIDSVSRSLVERGLHQAQAVLGDLGAQRAVVVGAGAMSGLAAHTLARAGVAQLTIINRTPERAERLALATAGVARDWDELADALRAADIVVSCTGSVGHILQTSHVAPRSAAGQPQVLIDLALPRDVDPAAGELPGITLLSLASLSDTAGALEERDQVRAVQDLVTAEVADYLVGRRAARVIPTVSALRSRAASVVDSEMNRLEHRVELTHAQQDEVRMAVHRIVEKILHTPTIRMKELAAADRGQDYTALLRMLFDLDPHDDRVAQIPRAGDLP